jgi:hypothetical protein
VSLPYRHKLSPSSITYKIPRSRFEVAWLSLSFESLAPVTPAAGSLTLFCNHFLHRLVSRRLQASSFFFFILQSLRWLSFSCSFASLAGSGARRGDRSANNNIHRQQPSLDDTPPPDTIVTVNTLCPVVRHFHSFINTGYCRSLSKPTIGSLVSALSKSLSPLCHIRLSLCSLFSPVHSNLR